MQTASAFIAALRRTVNSSNGFYLVHNKPHRRTEPGRTRIEDIIPIIGIKFRCRSGNCAKLTPPHSILPMGTRAGKVVVDSPFQFVWYGFQHTRSVPLRRQTTW